MRRRASRCRVAIQIEFGHGRRIELDDDDLITNGPVEEESVEPEDEQAKIAEALRRWHWIIDGMD
jgi:hypothetical protein